MRPLARPFNQPISRRVFLAGATAVTVAACSDSAGTTDSTAGTSVASTDAPVPVIDAPTTTVAATTTSVLADVELSGDPFQLGVASGDPDATSVVLWTRLAPEPYTGGGMPADDIEVLWEVSATDDFAEIAFSGNETATADHAHSVHAIAQLDRGDWFYRFRVGSYTSPVGVTRPAPPADEPLAKAKFAAASCQNFSDGYYAAHRDIAEQQPDFVVWLGDYIYEGRGLPFDPDVAARVHIGEEPNSLDDYRNRYGQYKSDPQLQASHAACPWFVIWDDHEVENNYAGVTPQDPADATGFQERRFVAYQAWWEHQPVRLDPPASADQEYRIYRDTQWGDLIELALLDGRQYRSDQACGDATLNLDPPCAEALDPTRTMLGAEQEQWLLDRLSASNAAWNVIGNQVILADANFNGAVLNYDQWDGYPVARARLLQAFADNDIQNLVVITGDIHLAAVAQLRAGDRATGVNVGAEFVTTSISSDGLIDDALGDVLRTFPNLVDAELAHRGYSLHMVTPERWTADYRIVTDVDNPDSEVTSFGTYTVEAGSNTVAKAS